MGFPYFVYLCTVKIKEIVNKHINSLKRKL